MISFLSAIFIKDNKNYSSAKVRGEYGFLCSVVGIVLNFLLFAAKLFAGTLANSLAVCADAFNNLSDAGSSLVTLLGFKVASRKPDPDHPFGHGRYEYISGLVVSIFIVTMGIELVKSSISKIASGTSDTSFTYLTAGILIASILVKVYIFVYNRGIGNKISSPSLKATGIDALSDCISTAVILACGFFGKYTSVNVDGWCGLVVSFLIIVAGVRAAKDTIDPLLGQAPSKDFVDSVSSLLLSHEEIVGIHDLVVHDYAPGHIMISVHAEISDKSDIIVAHELIDSIEKEISEKLCCEAVIHMDPVSTDDERVTLVKENVAKALLEIHEDVSIHDFRMVEGNKQINLIFDAVIPFEIKADKAQLKEQINALVKELDERYEAVVEIDRKLV